MTDQDTPPLTLTAKVHDRTAGIAPEIWNAIASNTRGNAGNPFLSHAFWLALEQSGSATPETGWLPQHILLEQDGTPIGLMPMFLKSHSQGEYVFDHGWADAFTRAGGNYYPKLQSSVPFTPATAPKLLGLGANADIAKALLSTAADLCHQLSASSVHATFLTEHEQDIAAEEGWLTRHDTQFHWHNDGYATFEDFLDTLASRKRKNIRKERRAALSSGLRIEWITGDDLTEAHWDAFFDFYMDTGSRKWGRPYLTRSFFSLISESMAKNIVLMFAYDGQTPIAGALNFIGADTIFGRNWGCSQHVPYLHFELCYYQAIDFAITHKLKTVEAGAQGEHKLARGYAPTVTRSIHWIEHPGLRQAVADYLDGERMAVLRNQEVLNTYTPFKKS